MSRIAVVCFFVLFACAELACFGGEPPPLPTVAGREATDLLAATHGYLVTPHRSATDQWTSEIALTTVPSLATRLVTPPREGSYVFVKSASGPDDRGRIAYVQANGWGDSARLNIIDVDGTNNRVIAAAVDPRHGDPFGAHFSIAPTGGDVAFLSSARNSWPNGEYVRGGTLTVWRADSTHVAIAPDAVDEGVAWFPDGNRLAYVARVSREVVERGDQKQLTSSVPNCNGWAPQHDSLALIYIVDVRSRVRRPLHVGTNPVVSTDGSAVMLDFCGGVIVVDTVGQHTRQAMLPGNLHRALALIDARLAVYWGLPTEGAPVERSPLGSFQAGTQLVTIKVAEIATGRFQTIIPAIDPRWEASFAFSRSLADTIPAKHTLAPMY